MNICFKKEWMLINNSDDEAQAWCCDNRLLKTHFYSYENNFQAFIKNFRARRWWAEKRKESLKAKVLKQTKSKLTSLRITPSWITWNGCDVGFIFSLVKPFFFHCARLLWMEKTFHTLWKQFSVFCLRTIFFWDHFQHLLVFPYVPANASMSKEEKTKQRKNNKKKLLLRL